MRRIDCFIPLSESEELHTTIKHLQECPMVKNIYVLSTHLDISIEGVEVLPIEQMYSSKTILDIVNKTNADYTLLYTKTSALHLGLFALERMVRIADDTEAGMLYADHYQIKEGKQQYAPVIDYQFGSLRNDFDFGSVLFFNTVKMRQAALRISHDFQFAGLYDLRLKLSQEHELLHINEYLYSEVELDNRKSGEKIFDYVDPRNRGMQIEMEQACTNHLKDIKGYLAPEFEKISFETIPFEYEASVIIPVRNRARTIADAIRSVLIQETTFKYNLIIIDNHSTDGTTEIIDSFAGDSRVIHLIPERSDLGIGGCWNWGVHHPKCGKFAVQLDSDDIYADEHTLQKIVDAFYQQQCAMVVGTYKMTNLEMDKIIPPGIIDHKEWTPENGRNNALRINGLGAPRAFYTPLLREIKVPNTSYGEDYALGLYFSRRFQIGRIYEVLYLCRRWEDNSDASLDITKMNQHNFYKDSIRTWELKARIKMNNKKEGQ